MLRKWLMLSLALIAIGAPVVAGVWVALALIGF
jgi:hypothetical protein